ncbi:hypothetical protein GCM10025792_31500 [Pseudonocardia tropica]
MPSQAGAAPAIATAVSRVSAAVSRSRSVELRAELEKLIEPTSEEDGYVDYDLHQGSTASS